MEFDLYFNFEDIDELTAFVEHAKKFEYSKPVVHEVMVTEPFKGPVSSDVVGIGTAKEPFEGAVVIDDPATQVDTKPMRAAGDSNITAKAVQDVLRIYKQNNGHKKYKDLLAYFGVSAVRDLNKSDFAAVMQMAQTQPAEADVISGIPEAPVTPPAAAPVAQEAPAPTPKDLRDALANHKARWGMDATKAALVSYGYPDPNDIPEIEYGSIISRLDTDNPVQDGDPLGLDLSAF